MLEPGFDYLPDDPTNLSQPLYFKDQNGKPIYDYRTGKPIISNYTQLRIAFIVKRNI